MRKRTFSAVALASAVVVALTACGSGDSGGDSGGTTEITYADTLFGNPKSGPLLQAMIDEFNASQTAVHVIPASIPFPTFGQTVLTQMGGGEGPDLIRFDTPEFFQAAKAGLLEPLDDSIDAAQLGLREGPDQFTSVDGTRYGVVSSSGSYTLLYNPDLVPTPPTDFDQFLATAKAATKDGVFGLAFRQTLPEEPGMWQDLWNYVYGFGGAWSDGQHLTLNSPGVIAGLTAYKELYDANVIPKGATASDYRTMFAAGKVAMEIDNGGTADNLRVLNPNLKLRAVQIPFPVKSTGMVLSILGVNAAGDHKDATLTFLHWLLTPDSQRKLLGVSGTGGAVATTVERTVDEVTKEPMIPVYDQATATGAPQVVRGFEDKTPEIRKIVVENVVDALQGRTDLQAAMDRAQQQATDAVGG